MSRAADQPNAAAADSVDRSTGRCVLRIADVEKSFHRGIPPRRRTIEVLKGASLMICAGELVGLVGENGSGKSTLMQIVVGLLERDGGEVERPRAARLLPADPDAVGQADGRRALRAVRRAPTGSDEDGARAGRGELLEELQLRPLPRLPRRGALRRHPPEAQPGAGADARARRCCCSTSPTPASTGRRTCASGR